MSSSLTFTTSSKDYVTASEAIALKVESFSDFQRVLAEKARHSKSMAYSKAELSLSRIFIKCWAY